ncbi:MAG: CRISPR-associated endonuclease Cas4g/Cas1g [Acidimicrobiia bacterium]
MTASAFPEVPELVPARMVNEFSYCPRLFYLEWVQARFQSNPDVEQGRFQHRAVDSERGRADPPDNDDPVKEARSVLIGSDRLGLIAKIDILEGGDGAVRPVDIKKGRPPDDDLAWEPERVQLCVQGLILRDNGYRCDEGVIYFVETRQRVPILFDEELIAKTLGLADELRSVAALDHAPPPLVDSPKCPRCSLVGICLPDETNYLAQRSNRSPRRLVPFDSEARPLYVTEQGATAGISGGRVKISRGKEAIAAVRTIDVSQISVFGNVQVTSQLIRYCFAEEIPICWFSYGGWFSGIAEGLPSKHVELRRRQVGIASQAGLPLARKMIEGKIRNCRTLLRRNARTDVGPSLESLKAVAERAGAATSIETLLGLEGTAARIYFSQFAAMISGPEGDSFDFNGRNRRPPRDRINCLLSYAYALLVKDLTAVLFSVGFDPYLGFYHRPRFGRPALALDLAEEFRPLVAESTVINAVNNGELKPNDFVVRAQGVALTQGGRKKFLTTYERRLDTEVRHPVFGYQVTYRRVFEVQARLLGAVLLKEIPEYTPFMTR